MYNCDQLYLDSLAEGSRRTIAQSLRVIAQIASGGQSDAGSLPWHQLRTEHTAAIRSALAERYAAATANKMLAALRGVLKVCWRLRHISSDDYHRAIDFAAVRGKSLPRGRVLADGELQALFAALAADRSAAGRRDAAISALLLHTGMERAEVVALSVGDYDAETGKITIRSGNRNNRRLAYAANESKAAIDDWITARGSAEGPLFAPVNRGGRVDVGRGITTQAVYAAMQKRAAEANIKRFSPDDLRCTCCTLLSAAGVDASMVQSLMGLASGTTMMRCDRRPEAAKRKAAEQLHLPYQQKPKLSPQNRNQTETFAVAPRHRP